MEYEGVVPESSLSPGRYVVGLVNPDFVASTEEELGRVIADGGLMARLAFEIAEPPRSERPAEQRPVASSLGDVRDRSFRWYGSVGWTD